MLTPCIACRKEVEETIPTCPHCGTLGPKRVLLVPCRICGKTVGKNARKCPHCNSHTPYKIKYVRDYLWIILAIGALFYIFNVIQKWVHLGEFYLLILGIAPIWIRYKDLKDASGLTNFLPLIWKTQKTPVFATCLQCKTIIHNKTEACPNCGEPVPNDI